MKLKFALIRPDGSRDDLVATLEPTTTVGALAAALVTRDPTRSLQVSPYGVTLAPYQGPSVTPHPFPPGATLADVGLRSGSAVRIAAPTEDSLADGPAAATLRVHTGPDAGREFPLRAGTNYLGRDRACDVRLTDPLVSKNHAKVNVGDGVELIDNNSSNGIILGGDRLQRVVLRPGDAVLLGDSEVTVIVHRLSATGVESGSSVEFNRSPRLDPRWEGREFTVPDPPQRPVPQRLPIVMLVAPIFMAAVLYAVTKNVASIAFCAMSPVMALGNWAEGRMSGRRGFRTASRGYLEALAALDQEVAASAREERASRLREHPAVADVADAVTRLHPMVWTRRPEYPGFLELRLGIGRQPARCAVTMPATNQTTPELWRQMQDLAGKYTDIDGVPVVGALTECGGIGVAGPADQRSGVARGLVAQLVGMHSPAEVVLTGMAAPDSAKSWDWVKWLPHASSIHSPLSGTHLAATPGACQALVAELEDLLADRSAGSSQDRVLPLPAIVLLVENDAQVERSRVVQLALAGPPYGIFVLWFAPSVDQLPASCRAFIELDPTGAGARGGFVSSGSSIEPLHPETLSEGDALALAVRLAPLVDAGARVDDDSDLPRSVSFVALAGQDLAQGPSQVLDRWRETDSIVDRSPGVVPKRRKEGSLRALVGQAAGQSLFLDLRVHGPHALVGGTTGAGKSEFLQSWILGMAAAHSPDRVTFLLVDYKGGSAFSECVRLPHTVGLVTDLSPHLVRRALTSLNAELKHREHILARKKFKDLADLEKSGDTEAPPSLVIVVDEFAALVQEVPEFVEGVVNVAQRGRSLGLHLILATQRPAGVIKDNLRANTNLRVALRMADEADSTDVVGSALAAGFDPAIPGRAVAKTGPGRLIPFQSAYAGGHTSAEPEPPSVALEQMLFGSPVRWEEPELDMPKPESPLGPRDIARVVDAILAASTAATVPAPRRPWLPELAPTYDLADLPTGRTDEALVFAVRDDPATQDQPAVGFEPDRDGNMAVFGAGGSGKSTVLRSLAVAAGTVVRGGPCHVYGLDFGARGLAMLETLPHVGSVIAGADHERVVRLIEWLRELVDERAHRYASVRAGSISDYRRLAGAPLEPRILVLLDGIVAFRKAYDATDRMRWLEMLISVASDGRPVGVHFVISSDQHSGLTTALSSSVQRRLVLRMASSDDYGMLGVPADVLSPDSPPGRGLLDQREVQVAVLGGVREPIAQARAVDAFGQSMRRSGMSTAPAIGRLPERIDLAELPVTQDDRVVVGVAGSTLGPFAIEPSGAFLVAGPPGSGRTTALHTLATALRRARPDFALHYFGPRRSPLASLDLWDGCSRGASEAGDAASALAAKLAGRADGDAPVAVFVEDMAEFSSSSAEQALQELARVLLAHDDFFVAEGETSALSSGFGLLGLAKSGRAGLALGPEQQDGQTIFRTVFPRVNRLEFPPGRALFVRSGKVEVVHLAEATGGLG